MAFKINFKGLELWYVADEFGEEGSLARLEHCNEEGQVTLIGLLSFLAGTSESFAHYWPDRGIVRYGEVIGSIADLQVVEPAVQS